MGLHLSPAGGRCHLAGSGRRSEGALLPKAHYEVGDGGDVVAAEGWNGRVRRCVRQRQIRHHRDDGFVRRLQRRAIVARAANFDLVDGQGLEPLHQHQIDGAMRPTSSSRVGAAPSASSCISAQRSPETTRTSVAPASRWRKESLPAVSISKPWWACLTVEALTPRLRSSGTSRVIRVVLLLAWRPTIPRICISFPERGC